MKHLLQAIARWLRRAALQARRAQLELTRSRVALTHPTDRVLRLHLDALIAEVDLQLHLMGVQAQ